ncbi:TadE family type IV pilus minor pilin [Curtobacterium sp. VKM Ac-1376]|uniref:TadE family type IV pilus minor pilin n=1 Tax=Curtobacterium sp. VKM Ac-1376 TaxID=123312 RepID=UPI00188B9350|nr:TadE family type IV pilus minor pilin [Curtobacterium sp. VKM Ac-1376]MBF4613725.1 pilus assembly protein [Curtobacterium sp. VKM Ac-1376]
MTVEFAVALPVVALVLTTLVAAVLVVDGQGRLQLAAATAARAIGRGDDADGRAAAARIAPGVSIAVRSDDGLVCVDATRGGTGPFAALPLSATGCAATRGR